MVKHEKGNKLSCELYFTSAKFSQGIPTLVNEMVQEDSLRSSKIGTTSKNPRTIIELKVQSILQIKRYKK